MILNIANLERLMKKEKLDKSKLARRLGLNRATIIRAMSGECQPSPKFLSALKTEFPEYNLEYFFDLSVPRK
jgi:transcriptional regulator with XRE-family HTH domain